MLEMCPGWMLQDVSQDINDRQQEGQGDEEVGRNGFGELPRNALLNIRLVL